MTEEKMLELLLSGNTTKISDKTVRVVACIWSRDGQVSFSAVSPDGTAILLTPKKQLAEVTFSPPAKNNGVRRVCWNSVKTYH